MEHKLILGGGEHYLPFARSRIKALRSAGLRYASQKFILPDAEVRVQLVNEIEYIWITGSGGAIAMDSGVVDVLSIAPLAPATYLAGILRESSAVLAYNAPFVIPDSGGSWRLNPASGSAGEVSGTIQTTGDVSGKVPIDGSAAKSFSPIKDAEGIDTTNDSSMVAKKTTAIAVPASIFTGRCRLYIQALYGAHLYQRDKGSPSFIPTPVAETSAAPALSFADLAVEGQTILVDTSTGIYLDPTTGKHWMICPRSGTTVEVFPMVASTAAKSLRRFLKAPYTLNETDREHIEAYILSQSRPTTAGRQLLTTETSVQAYSLGYGWHWNWTGLLADIVVNDQFTQDAINQKYAMVSTHYRLTMTLTDGVWAAVVTTVAGPTQWCAYRPSWILSEPNYADFTQDKTTPRLTDVFACSATFYAYYVRDELIQCRIDVTSQPSSALNVRTGWRDVAGTLFENHTLGLLPGYVENSTVGSRWEATVTIGTQVFGPVPYGGTITGTSIEVTNKVFTGNWLAGFGSEMFPQNIDQGYPPYEQVFEPTGVSDARQSGEITYDTLTDSFTGSVGGRILMGTPFYDAEAFFVDAVAEDTKSTTRARQPWINSATSGGQWLRSDIGVTVGRISHYFYEGYGLAAGLNHIQNGSVVNSVTVVVTPRFTSKYIVARDQLLDFSIDSTGPWLDNSSEIATPVYLLSGSQVGDKALATSSTHDAGIGMPEAVVAAPVLVGWV
jgi:hypothetical protein